MRAACVVVVVLLAGCAGEGGAEAEPDAFRDLQATDETGVIRGLVIDEVVTPVEGAKVSLSPGGLETISDADGAFGFANLDPGIYFLTVSALYHTTVQTSADVKAGVDKPPLTRVALQSIPRPEPRIQALTATFNMDGSTWVAGVGGAVLSTFLSDGTFTARLDVAPNATWIQSELVWTAAQPLAERLSMQSWLRAGGDAFADQVAAGASPITHAWQDPEQTARTEAISYELFVRDGTYPIGFTISQEVSLFTHVFQHFTPDEGWQFVRDGEHPLPP